ncbi:O-antigen ligase family protein [Bacillus timonensis]|uniref:O-antigen ligase family protein n=1 Tax=Bacillus timonensis TaxID=1033734 RepID=UPI000289D624|nr:O-antigen ligase family protein [Bacillus timonensis]
MEFLQKHSEKFVWLAVLLLFFIITAIQINILGYLLGFVLFIYALFKPKNAILLLFLYIPIRPFIIEYVGSFRYLGDFLIFGALFKTFWDSRSNIKSLFQFKLFEYALFAFLVIGSISSLFVTGMSIVTVVLQIRAFILMYLVYYIVKRMDITKKDVKNILWVTIWTVIAIIIQAIAEKLFIRTFLLPEAWQQMALSAKNRVRIYGMLGNPNVLSIYLSFVFLLFVYIKRNVPSVNSKLIAVLNWFVFAIIVLTYSRGTWIGFVVMLLTYLVISKRYTILKDFLKTAILSAIIVILPLTGLTALIENSDLGAEKVKQIQQYDQEGKSGFIDRIGGTFSDDTISSSQGSGRLFIVKKGFEVFLDNPIIGTGFGTFGDSASLRQVSPIYDDYDIGYQFYSDNQYIQIIAQTGALGVIAFAVYLLSMLVTFWKRRDERFSIVMIGVILAAYFMGLVYNLWEADIFGLCFFTLLAVANHSREELRSLHHSLESEK